MQVGPLTFAVAILDAATSPAKAAASAAPAKPISPDDISTDDIDSWLVGPNSAAVAEQPTAVYGGDTITITAFKDATASSNKSTAASGPSNGTVGIGRRIRASA